MVWKKKIEFTKNWGNGFWQTEDTAAMATFPNILGPGRNHQKTRKVHHMGPYSG